MAKSKSAAAPKLIIEICPAEPRASACLVNGEDVSADVDVYGAPVGLQPLW
jgi:hypothetical protein